MSDESGTTAACETAEVIVLGLGPGGEYVANKLAAAGVDVVGVDERLVGGECAFWGCVPSKAMIHAARLIAQGRRIPDRAGEASVQPGWSDLVDRVREVTDGWDDADAVAAFVDRGGRFVRGRGRVTGRHTVAVDGITYEATRGIVVATGTAPLIPPIDGLADTPAWTNREAVEATELPDHLLVIGGGPIGCELSQVFARFGSRVTLVEGTDRLLGGDEPEAAAIVHEALRRDGVEIRLGVEAKHVDHRDDDNDDDDQNDDDDDGGRGGRFAVGLDDGDTIDADRLLIVAGRDARLAELGVATIGCDPDADVLEVDDDLRVTEGVWAIGDVTGGQAFTHVAIAEARHVVAQLTDRPGRRPPYHAVPHVTFTDPELASVGLTEQSARDAGLDVATGITRGGGRAWLADRTDDALVKVVADRRRGVLVGATAVGPCGGEVIGLLTLAVHARMPIDEVRSMLFAYPTFHRAVGDAIDDLDGVPGVPDGA